jgi:hypothetical protein
VAFFASDLDTLSNASLSAMAAQSSTASTWRVVLSHTAIAFREEVYAASIVMAWAAFVAAVASHT